MRSGRNYLLALKIKFSSVTGNLKAYPAIFFKKMNLDFPDVLRAVVYGLMDQNELKEVISHCLVFCPDSLGIDMSPVYTQVHGT